MVQKLNTDLAGSEAESVMEGLQEEDECRRVYYYNRAAIELLDVVTSIVLVEEFYWEDSDPEWGSAPGSDAGLLARFRAVAKEAEEVLAKQKDRLKRLRADPNRFSEHIG